MSLSSADLTHLIAAAVLLLVAAHGLGRLAVRLHQPRVAGEILGGLLLGPPCSACSLPAGSWPSSTAARPPRPGWASPTSSACSC